MERNKWEVAIRCLEIALHPNTSDDEVIAGVNGFRRTADGTPLSDLCREFIGAPPPAETEPEPPKVAKKVEKLTRENLDLRQKLEAQREGQIAALRRLEEAKRMILGLSAEIEAEKQSFAEFRAASARLVDELKDENFDLRGALDTTSRALAERPASPFRSFLDAARQRDGTPAPEPAAAAPTRGPASRHPWTA